jgi:NAD+--asparagine ADP-ribosyltransferase
MRFRTLVLALALAAPPLLPAAAADTEADRLREALRGAITQQRALEDQRAALQAKVTEAESARAKLEGQVKAAKADIKQVEKQHREAVEEFNQRLADRDQTLEKWKVAYEEAADVARAKDAERAKFEAQATAFKASLKVCKTKNGELAKIGRELLQHYEATNFADLALASEPLSGVRRVEIQTLLQDYNDKILDQKVTP